MLIQNMRIFRKNRKKGFSTLTVILLMLVLAVSGVAVSSFISSGMSISMGQLQSTRAFYIAEAGLEWVGRAITYISGSAGFAANGKRIQFDIINNTSANVTLTGFTVTWDTPTAYYELVRIQGGAYSNAVIWDYANNGNVRAGDGENITFNTGPTVTLVSGTAYTLQLRNFNTQKTGSGSDADVRNANFRFAFTFTPNSKNLGAGTFTISVTAVSATENAKYTSTASNAGFSRVNSMASVCGFRPTE